MATANETCYPLLKRQSNVKELVALYSPSEEEVELAQSVARNSTTQLGFLVQLKSFQRLGYAVHMATIPSQICEHIAEVSGLRNCLSELNTYDSSRTRKRHLTVIREYLDIQIFDLNAQQIMVTAMDEAAKTKHDITDIVNVAIEQLVEHRFELPSFSRLLKVARQARSRNTQAIYDRVFKALTPDERTTLNGLFVQKKSQQQSSLWNRLKQEPGAPLLSRLKEWIERLNWLKTLQIGSSVLGEISAPKVAHFAAEAMTLDGLKMKEMQPRKRYTLALSLLSLKHSQALDDLAEFLIKRIRKLHVKGKTALDDYRKQTQDKTDELILMLRDLVAAYQQEGKKQDRFNAMAQVVGDEPQVIVDNCERHLAYVGDNYFPFLTPFYRYSRPVFFQLLESLPLASSTQDKSMMQAIEFITHCRSKRTEWIVLADAADLPTHLAQNFDVSWLPKKWRVLVTGQKRKQTKPKKIHKTYFEICVLSHLSLGLQAGDLHIPGSDQFDDYCKQLISWEEYRESIKEFGEMLDIPTDGKAFVTKLKEQLKAECQKADQRFPINPHVSYQKERLVLHKKRRKVPEDLKLLEKEIAQRIRPVNILDVLNDTQKWLSWADYFGPVSGHDAKIENPIGRYLLTTFCYGCNIGPSQLARALKNIDRRQLSMIHRRHVQEHTLQKAIESSINFYNRFSLPQFWGTGKHASVDGTKWNIYEQNLLAEYHIRYGGYGGIGYYHVSDNYIALFSHFIPCGVWEAIYILDGLFENKSEIQPDTIHGDTQAQSSTVFALAYLLGIKLMPRIRGWQNLTFYKPSGNMQLNHLSPLFNAIAPWKLVETHLPDMLRVALSIKAGKIQASTLFRKLGTNSPNNKLFQAFQALGGILRTIFLLQYLDDVDLRNMVQACTNKSESFNRLAKWLAFGGEQQVFASNDREELRKRVKYNHLVANCLILHNVSEISRILNDLADEGSRFSAAAIAALSPYLTAHINRFGLYSIDEERELYDLDFDLNPDIIWEEETTMETDDEAVLVLQN